MGFKERMLAFQGGAGVRTPCSHCCRYRRNLWSRNEDPACHMVSKKEKNRKGGKEMLMVTLVCCFLSQDDSFQTMKSL